MSARRTGSTAGSVSHVRISSGSISASVAARSITSGSSSASAVKVSTRSRRRKAGSRSGACRRVATTARHAGSDAPSSTGRQSIGMPYSSCSRRRLFATCSGGNVLAGPLLGQHDHVQLPLDLRAVEPQEPQPLALGGERERAAGSV